MPRRGRNSSITARSASAARNISPASISSRSRDLSSPTCPTATSQYVPDLIAGAVPVGFQWLPNVSAPLQSGDARALAVAASKRMTALPDVPTVAEAGIKNYEASGWLALLAPHGTPTPIIAKLNEELVAAVKDPQVTSKIIEQGAEGVSTTPEELAKFIASESVKWRNIIVKAGIPPIQ